MPVAVEERRQSRSPTAIADDCDLLHALSPIRFSVPAKILRRLLRWRQTTSAAITTEAAATIFASARGARIHTAIGSETAAATDASETMRHARMQMPQTPN